MSLPENQLDAVELAKRLKLTRQAIEKLLSGRSKKMNVHNNARVAELLNVDANWLATGDGVPQPDEFHVRWHERNLLKMLRALPTDEQDEFSAMLELRWKTHQQHAGEPTADPFDGAKPPKARGQNVVEGAALRATTRVRRAK